MANSRLDFDALMQRVLHRDATDNVLTIGELRRLVLFFQAQEATSDPDEAARRCEMQAGRKLVAALRVAIVSYDLAVAPKAGKP